MPIKDLVFGMWPLGYDDCWGNIVEVNLDLLSVLERMQRGIRWIGDFPFISDLQLNSCC